MQDLKDNAADKNGRNLPANAATDYGSDSKPRPHGFDQQVQAKVKAAEVIPPMELMDKIFDKLAQETLTENMNPKTLRSESAPLAGAEAGVPDATTKRRSIKNNRKLYTYAAAIAAILVVLALGIRELTNRDTTVLPPANLVAITHKNVDSPAVVQPQGTIDSKTAKDENKGIGKDNNKGLSSKVEPDYQANMAKVPENKLEQHSAEAVANTATQKTRVIGSEGAAPKQSENNLAGIIKPGKSGNASLLLEPTLVKPKVQGESGLVSSGAGKQVEVNANANKMVNREAAALALSNGNQGDLSEVQLEVDKLPTTRTAAVNLTEKSAGMGRTENKRGLFKGLFKKIGKSARAITDDVISQDEDKTVIKVGFLAITAYK